MTRQKLFQGLGITILIITAAASAYALSTDFDSTFDPNASTSSPAKAAEQPKLIDLQDGKTITVVGEFHCLVPEGDGPHTMECAFGLRQAGGAVFGLSSDDPMLLGTITGEQIEVTGILSESKQTKFKTNGTIKVTSLKQL